ncbi:MAG TPA: hypothetical protein VFN76_00815, partial [Candidatus Limnocylindria bacterium]|nr:hypothetical protein [Candidatus Limnocylindria bacterium]
DNADEPPAWPTLGEAIHAAGLDPAEVLEFGDHAAVVHRGADATVSVTAWHRVERGWTGLGGTTMTRIGPLADAVIMGGVMDTNWQVAYMYGFLPAGVTSVEPRDGAGSELRVAPSRAYLLVLGDIHDPGMSTPQSVAWRMRDAAGTVVREGTGDCCPDVDE